MKTEPQDAGPNTQNLHILLKKLHAVMSAVDYIQKDKTNEHHKYRYASEQAIKEVLHAELVKNKILFRIDVTDVRHEHGDKQTLTTISVRYIFQDVETAEMIEGLSYGTGIDNQDKGLYKAITGAIKYILTSTFLIPTGDDPENEEKTDPNAVVVPRGFSNQPAGQAKISENQAKRLWAIARGVGWGDLETREFLSGKGYASTSDIPRSAYDGVIRELEAGGSR